MDSPAVILLCDPYGKRNPDQGAFVLCPLYGRKSKAFQAASGTLTVAIITNLVSYLFLHLKFYFLSIII